MKDYFVPAIGIIVVTIILVVINELTETTFIKDYALILIIAAMLLGVGLTKISVKKGDKK
jgi:ABC-type Mn2+/Zn2+ transport system permease subunit